MKEQRIIFEEEVVISPAAMALYRFLLVVAPKDGKFLFNCCGFMDSFNETTGKAGHMASAAIEELEDAGLFIPETEGDYCGVYILPERARRSGVARG